MANRRLKSIVGIFVAHWFIVVTLAMVLTYALTMLIGMKQSIWFDESYSIILAKRPVDELLALTAVDAHPPFYYLYLKVWASVFGWSEFALRSSSAILGAAGVGIAAAIIRKMFSTRVALATLPFVMLAPFLLRYDFEIRMYAMASLIGLAATWVLLRASESNQKRWWYGYAALVALGMYTLYMTVVIWFAHVIWLAIVKYRQTKSFRSVLWQPAVLSYVGAVALFAPYLPTFVSQMQLSALPPGMGSVMTSEKFIGIFSELFSYRPDWLADVVLRLVLFAVLLLAGFIGLRVFKQAKQKDKKYIALLLSLAIVPIVFYAIISYALAPIFVFRYMAHVAIYIYILVGLLIVLGWKKVRRAAVILGVIVAVLLVEGTVYLYREGNYNLERTQYPMGYHVRQAIECNDDTIVITDDLYTYIDMQYYFEDCDLRFRNPEDPRNVGGYAVLRGNDKRITSIDEISAPKVVHIYQNDIPRTLHPESKYTLIKTLTFDKNTIGIYEKS